MQHRRTQAGFSLIEILLALSILAGVILVVNSSVDREGSALAEMTRRAEQELTGQALIGQVREVLNDAQGIAPQAFLLGGAGPGDTANLSVDTVLGFPDTDVLLLRPGAAAEERVAYQDIVTGGGPRFQNLERATGPCGAAAGHPAGASVIWAGLGIAIENQTAPPAGSFEGRSQERLGPVFFRGEGTGFSFRVPTDPAGGTDYFDGLDVRWGSRVSGQPLLTGRSAIRYVSRDQVTEAVLATDLNGDGDQADTFELGSLLVRSWDTRDGGVAASEYQLRGSGILQELCNRGSDLDGDGFEDPIFLWDPESGRLRVRLFLLDRVGQRAIVTQRVESVMHLKNPTQV